MTPMFPGIFSAFAAFALFAGSVVVCFQLAQIRRRLAAMTVLWMVFGVAYVGLYVAFRGAALDNVEHLVFFANGFLIYLLLFFAFCYCYFVSDHSLSVLYMLALEDLPEKRMSHLQLLEKFPYRKLLEPRMTDLENSHFVVRRAAHYELTPKGRMRARIAGTLKRFLKLEPGG
jgi:hypothetical protein